MDLIIYPTTVYSVSNFIVLSYIVCSNWHGMGAD